MATRRHDSRDVAFLLGSMGLNSLPWGFTLVVLPIYLNEIGFSAQVIGAVTSVSSVANTIALIPFAFAADQYGRKPFVLAGFLLATPAFLLFAFTHDLNALFLASALGGVGLAGGFSSAVWTPAWTALLADKSHERRTGAFAWSQGIWALALTVGSAMSVIPFLLRMNFGVGFGASYTYAFLLLAGFAVFSGLVLLPVRETPSKHVKPVSSREWFRLRSGSQIAKFSVTVGMVGFGSGLAVQLVRRRRSDVVSSCSVHSEVNAKVWESHDRPANAGPFLRFVGSDDSCTYLPVRGGALCCKEFPHEYRLADSAILPDGYGHVGGESVCICDNVYGLGCWQFGESSSCGVPPERHQLHFDLHPTLTRGRHLPWIGSRFLSLL